MSVGVVVNEPESNWWSNHSPEEIFMSYINRSASLRDRFQNAQQIDKIRIMKKLPYTTTQSVGNGWILVGDANFFVDPLFSSGVHVAFHSAEKAAAAITHFLSNNRSLRAFKEYERWVRRYQFHIFTTINLFYKMLKYRGAMMGLIHITSQDKNKFGNWVAQRLRSWLAGYFEQFYAVLYGAWFLGSLTVQFGIIREKILGIPGWSEPEDCQQIQPLQIPKISRQIAKSEGSLPIA
jgi:flavin-dependent dehydrogenase